MEMTRVIWEKSRQLTDRMDDHGVEPGPFRDAAAEFAAVLEGSGLHVALGFLNARARFRFTGVYRCEPESLVNRALYDRENPSIEQCGGITRLEGTFCSIVIATGQPFATGNSPADPKLESYHVRETVISYTGVPIRNQAARVVGVLCHYDLRPRLLPHAELRTLISVAPLLADRLDIGE